jgi:hypothetical protein
MRLAQGDALDKLKMTPQESSEGISVAQIAPDGQIRVTLNGKEYQGHYSPAEETIFWRRVCDGKKSVWTKCQAPGEPIPRLKVPTQSPSEPVQSRLKPLMARAVPSNVAPTAAKLAPRDEPTVVVPLVTSDPPAVKALNPVSPWANTNKVMALTASFTSARAKST